MKGLTHLYCGDGKGKTSAAIGVVIRQVSCHKKVAIFSFLKDGSSSENKVLQQLGVQLFSCEMPNPFYYQMDIVQKQVFKQQQEQLFSLATSMLHKVDCIVLDEVMDAIQLGFFPLSALLQFIAQKPKSLELIITAHQEHQDLVAVVDYYTYFENKKHPYQQGIPARKGVDL